MTSVRPAAPNRLAWIDAVRGACVAVVVLFHVTAWHVLPLGLPPLADSAWSVVNGYLGSLRMPLLLAVSGLLASRRVLQGWGSSSAAERAASSYYLYVVWLTVYAVVYAVLDSPWLPHSIDGVGEAAVELVWPQTPLWYVFALAVYVLVLTSLSRVRPWLVLAGLAIISIVVQVGDWDVGLAVKVPELAFFFAVGVYGRVGLGRFAEQLDWRRAAVAGGAAAATVLVGPIVPDGVLHAVLVLIRGLAFLLLGVAVLVALLRWRPLARAGSWLGQRTLPVYVLHVPLLLLAITVLGRSAEPPVDGLLSNTPVALGYPLVLTAVLIALTLLLHQLLLRLHAGALFAMPTSWTGAVRRAHARLARRVPAPAPAAPVD
jgi:uncharacterized membrane protein YcfT